MHTVAPDQRLFFTFTVIAPSLAPFPCSGISDIRAYLNGIHIRNLLSIRTLVAKSFGVAFAIASGLVAGKEVRAFVCLEVGNSLCSVLAVLPAQHLHACETVLVSHPLLLLVAARGCAYCHTFLRSAGGQVAHVRLQTYIMLMPWPNVIHACLSFCSHECSCCNS